MTAPVTLRPAEECRWDLVSLGEVMLRLDPGEQQSGLADCHDARVVGEW